MKTRKLQAPSYKGTWTPLNSGWTNGEWIKASETKSVHITFASFTETSKWTRSNKKFNATANATDRGSTTTPINSLPRPTNGERFRGSMRSAFMFEGASRPPPPPPPPFFEPAVLFPLTTKIIIIIVTIGKKGYDTTSESCFVLYTGTC